MKIKSIRTRLPISYAVLSLLTVTVLGGILFLNLQSYYQSQEFNYLNTNAELMAPGLTQVLEEGEDITSLQIYVQNLSYLIQARKSNYLIPPTKSLQIRVLFKPNNLFLHI